MQFVAATAARPPPPPPAGRRRFEIKHLAINTGLQIRVLTLRYTGNRNDPLWQSIKIDLHRDWTTWTTLTATAAFTTAAAGTATTAAASPAHAPGCSRRVPVPTPRSSSLSGSSGLGSVFRSTAK